MASVSREYQQYIRPSGCAGGPCLLPVSVLGQQKARPGTYQTAKNRLHSATTWAKITVRRIIRAGHEVRQHPMTLCRSRILPHSKKTCATLIIPILPAFYKGFSRYGFVCCWAVQGISIPARPFCSPRRSPRGLELFRPLGRSAGQHPHTNPTFSGKRGI